MAAIVTFPAKKAGGRLCVDCDEQIDPRRLRASPAARRCTPCQTLRDKIVSEAVVGSGDKGIVIIKG